MQSAQQTNVPHRRMFLVKDKVAGVILERNGLDAPEIIASDPERFCYAPEGSKPDENWLGDPLTAKGRVYQQRLKIQSLADRQNQKTQEID